MSQGKWLAKKDFDDFYKQRGEKLRAFRIHSGYSRVYIGKLVNACADSVKNWEEGRVIRREYLEALEKIGIPKSWLYGGTQPQLITTKGRKKNVKSRKRKASANPAINSGFNPE
jgi:DNA-binding XRE family transcriptional regulator